jgi:hypothetical protein
MRRLMRIVSEYRAGAPMMFCDGRHIMVVSRRLGGLRMLSVDLLCVLWKRLADESLGQRGCSGD